MNAVVEHAKDLESFFCELWPYMSTCEAKTDNGVHCRFQLGKAENHPFVAFMCKMWSAYALHEVNLLDWDGDDAGVVVRTTHSGKRVSLKGKNGLDAQLRIWEGKRPLTGELLLLCPAGCRPVRSIELACSPTTLRPRGVKLVAKVDRAKVPAEFAKEFVRGLPPGADVVVGESRVHATFELSGSVPPVIGCLVGVVAPGGWVELQDREGRHVGDIRRVVKRGKLWECKDWPDVVTATDNRGRMLARLCRLFDGFLTATAEISTLADAEHLLLTWPRRMEFEWQKM